jgi:hypothetical protein
LRHLLRIYSYAAEGALSLAALAMSAIVVFSPHVTVSMAWLPWSGEALGAWLAALGLLGLLFVVLAMAGRARFLLTLFSLFTLVLIARGFFFSSLRFAGMGEAKRAALVVMALLLAFAGSIPMSRKRARGYR